MRNKAKKYQTLILRKKEWHRSVRNTSWKERRSAIPAHFTDQLELRDVIEEMATDLFTGCIISEYDERNTPEKMRWFDKYCCQHWEPLR